MTSKVFAWKIAVGSAIKRLPLLPICAFGLFLYLLLCPAVNEWLYQGMALHPTHDYIDTTKPVSMGNYKGEHIFFPVRDGRGNTIKLHGIYFTTNAPQKRGTVILSHGNGFCVAPLIGCEPAVRVLEQGLDLFMYDYEGYGESGGTPNYRRLGKDALAAVDYVSTVSHKTPVVLYGLSMGTGVSSYAAARTKVDGVILDSPFISPEKTVKLWFPIVNIYPDWMFPEPHYDNAVFLASKHVPTLVIIKGQDAILGTEQGLSIAKTACQPTFSVLLENSAHHTVAAEDDLKYVSSLHEFFDKVTAGQDLLQSGGKQALDLQAVSR